MLYYMTTELGCHPDDEPWKYNNMGLSSDGLLEHHPMHQGTYLVYRFTSSQCFCFSLKSIF